MVLKIKIKGGSQGGRKKLKGDNNPTPVDSKISASIFTMGMHSQNLENVNRFLRELHYLCQGAYKYFCQGGGENIFLPPLTQNSGCQNIFGARGDIKNIFAALNAIFFSLFMPGGVKNDF